MPNRVRVLVVRDQDRAELDERLAHGGQLRRSGPSLHCVVEAHDADVLGHPSVAT